MAIKRTSLAICLLFSLATIATAYYSPSSPPVHQSPVYTHKPYTPTSSLHSTSLQANPSPSGLH
ncbi:unnamed protein product [Brassica oleracea]